jgi:hypothetical protein
MKAEDVPDEWVEALRKDRINVHLPPRMLETYLAGLRSFIAKAAPLIAKAERERITEDLRRMSGGHVAHECALIHRVIERIESAAMPTVAATVET